MKHEGLVHVKEMNKDYKHEKGRVRLHFDEGLYL